MQRHCEPKAKQSRAENGIIGPGLLRHFVPRNDESVWLLT
jgi:hypothetical protein